jgi:magnesium transporter
MSSTGSVREERLDSRYSTPAPELDDHRHRLGVQQAQQQLHVPNIELQLPTPRPSDTNERELLSVDEALLNSRDQNSNPVTRDFEQAVEDEEKSDVEGDAFHSSARHHSGRARRATNNREGRTPRLLARHDRSRDSSSSRSTSPANSLEAFAEPRRRQRANTAESHSSSALEQFRNRTYSHGTGTRRPTLSNISLPPAFTHRTDRDEYEDVTFPTDDEPGKTYKIDFEELEEFVVLSAQGKIPDDVTEVSNDSRNFEDERKQHESKNEHQNAALNGEHFFEKPVVHHESHGKASSSEDQIALKQHPAAAAEQKNRFFLFTSELSQGQRASKLGDFVADGTSFRDLFDIGPEGGVWWLDVLNPTKAELNVLCKAFKIHRLTQEDIETQEAREKVELFSQYYFVCFRTFNMDKNHEDFLDPVHVYICVCGDGVLSFSYHANPHAKNVRRRISKLGDFVSLGPDYICYAMIDDIVDCFAPIILDAEHESENIEDQVFIAREDDLGALLRQIGECRKRVLNMMRLLGGKADVIKGFAKRCNDQYQMTPRGDIGLYLGDIQDHVVTMMSNLNHVEKMLSRSHANYLAQLNVDNILKGNTTNKTLAKITVLATIIVPLNIVTGLFGMNVDVPGKNTAGLYWFFGIVGFMCLFVFLGLVLARRVRAI